MDTFCRRHRGSRRCTSACVRQWTDSGEDIYRGQRESAEVRYDYLLDLRDHLLDPEAVDREVAAAEAKMESVDSYDGDTADVGAMALRALDGDEAAGAFLSAGYDLARARSWATEAKMAAQTCTLDDVEQSLADVAAELYEIEGKVARIDARMAQGRAGVAAGVVVVSAGRRDLSPIVVPDDADELLTGEPPGTVTTRPAAPHGPPACGVGVAA